MDLWAWARRSGIWGLLVLIFGVGCTDPTEVDVEIVDGEGRFTGRGLALRTEAGIRVEASLPGVERGASATLLVARRPDRVLVRVRRGDRGVTRRELEASIEGPLEPGPGSVWRVRSDDVEVEIRFGEGAPPPSVPRRRPDHSGGLEAPWPGTVVVELPSGGSSEPEDGGCGADDAPADEDVEDSGGAAEESGCAGDPVEGVDEDSEDEADTESDEETACRSLDRPSPTIGRPASMRGSPARRLSRLALPLLVVALTNRVHRWALSRRSSRRRACP